MPSRKRPAGNSQTIVWVVVGSVALVGLGGVLFFLAMRSGTPGLPGFGPRLDPASVENTRAWAAEAVNRLKEAEASKDTARLNAEITRIEKQLKDTLLGAKVRWTFPVEAVADGDVKLDSFFGNPGGAYQGNDQKLRGRPTRLNYLQIYMNPPEIGDEVTQAQAALLRKGSPWTVVRSVKAAELSKHEPWWGESAYTEVVDVRDAYCIILELNQK